jgi:hypothetical protein
VDVVDRTEGEVAQGEGRRRRVKRRGGMAQGEEKGRHGAG